MQHLILTRFNLLLWNKDKEGNPVRTTKWLEHRFALFEKYCLPSIANQTCKSFEWIVLFDSSTPERFKEKITECQSKCPQLIPIYVSPNGGRFFAQIFRDEVVKRLKEKRVITTYLDNDDALNVRFVEDIQKRAEALPNGTFINYTHGFQFYTDHKYLLQVNYPRNHFMSVVESGDPLMVKTIYGYGSHYYIDKIEGVRIEKIKNQPMWCEVIHEKNMGNDAYFLFGSKTVKDRDYLRNNYSIDQTLNTSRSIYLFRFIPRFLRVFVRRIKYYFFGRHW